MLELRDILQLILDAEIPNDTARDMIASFDSGALADVLLDTFNCISGCYAYNARYLESED